jgi:hypothetical protein
MNATLLRQSLLPATLLAGITLSTITVPLAALYPKPINVVQNGSLLGDQQIESVLPTNFVRIISLGMGIVSVAIAGRWQAHSKGVCGEEAVIVLNSYWSHQDSDNCSEPLEMGVAPVSKTASETLKEMQLF